MKTIAAMFAPPDKHNAFGGVTLKLKGDNI
jgi:hypothetical protein